MLRLLDIELGILVLNWAVGLSTPTTVLGNCEPLQKRKWCLDPEAFNYLPT